MSGGTEGRDPTFLPESFWNAIRLSDEGIQDPFPHFRALGEDVAACSHAAAAIALKDHRVQVLPPTGLPGAMWSTFDRWLIMRNAPEHTNIRRLFSRAFTKSAVEAYRPLIQRTLDALLDRLVPRKAMDFRADFAFPLPTAVISELMGLSDASREGLDELLVTLDEAFVFQLDDAHTARGNAAVEELLRRMDAELEARRSAPTDDLLGRLVRGEDGSLDVDIAHDDLVANAVLLLQAGQDTTMNALTSGVFTLLTNPDQFDKLRHNPSLVPSAVEEFVRYNSPIGIAPRVITEDMELPVGVVPAGATVPFFLGAVNRDTRVFEDPDRFDVARTPNPHLAFAAGAHLCVGAPLARLELQLALRAVIDRLPNLRLTGEPRWTGVLPFRGLDALPVEWD